MVDLSTAARSQVGQGSASLARNGLLLVVGSVAAVPVAVLAGLTLRERVPVVLDDLINLSDPAYPKQIDLYAVAVWVVFAVLFGAGLMRMPGARRAGDRVARAALRNPGRVLVGLAVLTPVIPWLTNPAGEFPAAQLRASLATALAVGVAGVVVYARRGLGAARALTTLAVVVGALLAVVTATSPWLPQVPARVVVLAVAVLALTLATTTSRVRAGRAVLVSQALIPLLLLVLVLPLGAATAAQVAVVVTVLIGVLILSAVGRIKALWPDPDPVGVVHPATVATLSAYFVGLVRLPTGGVPTDEYHYGELLTQWPQIVRFGSRPFVDFVPAPGLDGTLFGAVNVLVGDTSITFQRAVQITLMLFAASLALLLCRILGAWWALLLVPAGAAVSGAISTGDRLAAVGVATALLVLPGLWRRPGAWLGAWLLSVAACLLFMPGTGTAFAAASSIPAVVQTVRYLRTWRQRGLVEHLTLLAAVLLMAPVAPLLVDLLRFVLGQGQGNTVAWGLPLFPSEPTMETAFIAALDMVRMAGWWLGLPLCAALLLARGRTGPVGGMRLIAASTVVFLLALIPYTFGRVEKSGLSRLGLATVFVLGLVLPVAVGGARAVSTGGFGRLLTKALALGTAVVVGVPGVIAVTGLGGLRPMAAAQVDGEQLGLPHLGTGPAAQADSLALRAGILRAVDGPFLDLSSNTALYYFAGVPLPIPVPAQWNLVTQADQQAGIDALAANPPAVVFLGTIDPNDPPWWDRQLRSYRVTRWLLENDYRAYDVAGQTVLLSPGAAASAGPEFVALTPPEADGRLVSSYSRLADQYATWGANWELLADRFIVVPTRVSADTLQWSATDPGPDFLRVNLACNTAEPGVGLLTWPVPDGSVAVSVPLKGGTSLVPLGAYPSWHAAQGQTLTIAAPPGCTVGDAAMLRLVQ